MCIAKGTFHKDYICAYGIYERILTVGKVGAHI